MDGYDPVPGKCNFWRERLNDEDLTGEALQEEIHRSRVIASVSGQIIANVKASEREGDPPAARHEFLT